MTLGEAKNKVYMLLDEHSAGGEVEHDEDIEKKMTAFFDTAQKTLAQIRRIVREYALPLAMGKTAYEMPPDFSALYRVWADGHESAPLARRKAPCAGGVRRGDRCGVFRRAEYDPDGCAGQLRI